MEKKPSHSFTWLKNGGNQVRNDWSCKISQQRQSPQKTWDNRRIWWFRPNKGISLSVNLQSNRGKFSSFKQKGFILEHESILSSDGRRPLESSSNYFSYLPWRKGRRMAELLDFIFWDLRTNKDQNQRKAKVAPLNKARQKEGKTKEATHQNIHRKLWIWRDRLWKRHWCGLWVQNPYKHLDHKTRRKLQQRQRHHRLQKPQWNQVNNQIRPGRPRAGRRARGQTDLHRLVVYWPTLANKQKEVWHQGLWASDLGQWDSKGIFLWGRLSENFK